MLGSPGMQMYLQVINERRKLARGVLLGVLLLFGIFALWARQYSASAFVRLTSSSTEQPRASAVEVARSRLNDERLAAIMEQIPLYPEMVRTHGKANAIRYMRSRISLQPVGPGNYNTGEVRVTYLSTERATVVKVANALSQSLAEVKPSPVDSLSVDIAARIERQLEDSRSKLRELAARQQKQAKGEGVPTSRRRTSVHEDEKRLSVVEQQKGQTSDQGRVGSSAALVSAPVPETSAVKALQQRIRDAEALLIELRQRYTDQYPDVQDTQEQLQELRSKLNRLPVESPSLPARDDGRIAREEEQVRADRARAQKEIRRDTARKETKRDTSSKSSTVALELDRYQALLRAQRNMKEYQDEGLGSARMRFTVVQKATRAKAAGIAVNPFYWLSGLLAGLFTATLSVLFAHRLKAPPQEQIATRSQFERAADHSVLGDVVTPYGVGAVPKKF